MQPPPPSSPPPPGPPPSSPPPPAAQPTAPAPQPGRSRRGAIIGGTVGGVVALALIGGGIAYAASPAVRTVVNSWLPFLDGARPSAATVLPADATMFVGFDVDPTSEQKVAMYDFFDAFPALDEYTSSDAPIAQLILETVAPEDSGIDYETDIEPWLGHTIGVSLSAPVQTPDSDFVGIPPVTIAVASTDDAAARAGLEKIVGEPLDDTMLAFRDGFAVLSPTGELPAADGPTLASTDFTTEVDQLGGTGPLVYWQDSDALIASSAELYPPLYGTSPSTTPTPEDPFENIDLGTFAMTLRFAGGSAELAGRSFGVHDYGMPVTQSPVELSQSLPDDTAVFLQADGVGAMLQYLWDNAETIYADTFPDEQVAEFKASAVQSLGLYGIDPNTDLALIFGEQLLLSTSPAAFDSVTTGAAPSGIGLRVRTDAEALSALLQAALADAEAALGAPIATSTADGVFTIGSDQAYVDQLVAGGSLGARPEFGATLPDSGASTGALWADLSYLPGLFTSLGAPEEVLANLRQLDALGVTVSPVGEADYGFRLIVTSTDEG